MKTILNWLGAICLALVYLIVCLGASDDTTNNTVFKIILVLMTVAALSIGLPKIVDDILNKGSED